MMQIIPIKELKDTNNISRLCKENNDPIFVTKNGYGELVVMSMEYYQKFMEQEYVAKLINEAHEDYLNGNVVDGQNFFEEMSGRYAE